jgi:hypothetical protein
MPARFWLCLKSPTDYDAAGTMHWIAPSENDTDNAALEKRLWDAADQFRANSGLASRNLPTPPE